MCILSLATHEQDNEKKILLIEKETTF